MHQDWRARGQPEALRECRSCRPCRLLGRKRATQEPRWRTRETHDASFDHLVGAGKKRGRDLEIDRSCRFETYHELEPLRLLRRQLARLFASQNSVSIV